MDKSGLSVRGLSRVLARSGTATSSQVSYNTEKDTLILQCWYTAAMLLLVSVHVEPKLCEKCSIKNTALDELPSS